MSYKLRDNVTKREAERTLAAVKRMFRSYIKAGYKGPELRENWEWGWSYPHTYRWAIVWEEGPFEWVHVFPFGGIDEEFGFRHDAVNVPDGTYTEAITSWAVAVYPA